MEGRNKFKRFEKEEVFVKERKCKKERRRNTKGRKIVCCYYAYRALIRTNRIVKMQELNDFVERSADASVSKIGSAANGGLLFISFSFSPVNMKKRFRTCHPPKSLVQ